MITINKKDGGYVMKAQTKMGVSSSEKYPPSNFVFFNSDNFLKENILDKDMVKKKEHGLKGRKQSKKHIENRMNAKRKKGSIKLSKKDISDIKRKYLSGKNTTQLSKEYGCTIVNIIEHLDKAGIKRRKGGVKKGHVPWNKGKKGVQVGWLRGKKGMGVIKSKRKGKSLEEIYDKETAKKMRKNLIENRKYQVFPKKDSSIEVKLQNYLKKLGIEFYTHQYMDIENAYQCDIYIPKQIRILKNGEIIEIKRTTIIEAFGDYWHNRPRGREIDTKRCNELREKGYRVLVFWEHEIKPMKLKELKEVINDEK